MSFFDKIKNIVSVPDDDYYESDEQENMINNKSKDQDDDMFGIRSKKSEPVDSNTTPFPTEKRNKYVNIHATTQLQVVLVKPERFDDAPSIADHLNSKRTVVLNLEAANKETARRLIDFLSGVAYANNGQIKRVANSTFIITPFNVDIMGDLILDELESSSLYM